MSAPERRLGPRRSRRGFVLAAVALAFAVVGLVIGIGGDPGAEPLSPLPLAGASMAPQVTDLPMDAVPAVQEQDSATPSAASPDVPVSAGLPSGSTPGAAPGIRASRIRIARLGIDLAIVEGDGIDAPIGRAAHYPGSAWPGGGSNIYIYGHARKGMFITLWGARIGDAIVIDLVDGTSRTYEVSRVLPKVPWDAVSYLEPTPMEQLSIQTSTSYHPTAPRFIVIAVPTP